MLEVEDLKYLYSSPEATFVDYFHHAAAAQEHLLESVDEFKDFTGYRLFRCELGNNDIRPINEALFIWDNLGNGPHLDKVNELINIAHTPTDEDRLLLRRYLYTIERSLEAYLDIIGNAQQVRKIAGHIFEGLLHKTLVARGLSVYGGEVSFHIHSETATDEQNNEKIKLSFDRYFTNQPNHKPGTFDSSCVVFGAKVTTKDRGNMFFVDRYLYEKTHAHRPKFIAIALNDVQRKRKNNKTVGVSWTFLPGHFRLYSHIFGELDGYYFIDPPPVVDKLRPQFNSLKTIDELFYDDIPSWSMNND